MALVDKDQIDILTSLRASVASEKADLESEVSTLKIEIWKLKETSSMQLSQINTLLMDKVALQGDTFQQRERVGGQETAANASLQEALAHLEALRSEGVARQAELDQTKEKLAKARRFIREQDRLFKEQHAKSHSGEASFGSEEESFKAQIEALQAALSKQQALNDDIEAHYQRETRFMLAAWQEIGMHTAMSRVAQDDQPALLRAPPARQARLLQACM